MGWQISWDKGLYLPKRGGGAAQQQAAAAAAEAARLKAEADARQAAQAAAEAAAAEAARLAEIQRLAMVQAHVTALHQLTTAHQTAVTQLSAVQQVAEASRTALAKLITQTHQAEASRRLADAERQFENIRNAETERLFEIKEVTETQWFTKQMDAEQQKLETIEQIVTAREVIYPQLSRQQQAKIRARQSEAHEKPHRNGVERLKVPGGSVRFDQDLAYDKTCGQIIAQQDATRWIARCELDKMTAERQISLITLGQQVLEQRQRIELQQIGRTAAQINSIQEQVTFYETYTPTFTAYLAPYLISAQQRLTAEKAAVAQMITDKKNAAAERSAVAEESQRADFFARKAEKVALLAAEESVVAQQHIVVTQRAEVERLARAEQAAAATCLTDNLTQAERLEATQRAQTVEPHVREAENSRTANEARVTLAAKEREAARMATLEFQQCRHAEYQLEEKRIFAEYGSKEQQMHEAQRLLEAQRMIAEQRITTAQKIVEARIFSESKHQDIANINDWKSRIGFDEMSAVQQIAWIKLYQQEESAKICSYALKVFIKPLSSEPEDAEVVRRIMLNRLDNSCTRLLAAAEKRLATEQAAEVRPQTAFIRPGALSQKTKTTTTDRSAAPSQPLSDSPKSLELILKYCFEAITAKEHVVFHSLTDESISPGTCLFMWDLISIMVTHAPKVTYNDYALQDEKSWGCMRRFFAQPNRCEPSLLRMIERFNHDGAHARPASGRSGVDFDLTNPALAIASQSVLFLKRKAPKTGRFFAVEPDVRDREMLPRVQDAEFETCALDIEARAKGIDPFDLPAEIFKKMASLKACHEKPIAKHTMTF